MCGVNDGRQLLACNVLVCSYNPTNKYDNYLCDIQPTTIYSVVTMAMEVLHNNYNMCLI